MELNILPNNFHHAYCVFGEKELVKDEILRFIETELGFRTRGNPDVSDQRFGVLGIDEAREIKRLAGNKSFSDTAKIFLIEAESITHEAQNSLLKIFEEPGENTYFFLIGNCVKNLIPTLISRVVIVRCEVAAPAAGAATDFLSITIVKRLAIVKKLVDEIKDEKKTKADALALIHQIENVLYQKSKKEGTLPPKILEDIEKCREYMSDRSASVKMLLEHIALVTPHTL